MKLVFVNPAGGLGGAERSLLDILSVVRDTSVRPSLLVLEHGPLAAEAEKLGVETHVIPMPRALVEMGDFGLRAKGHLGALTNLAARSTRMTPELFAYVIRLRYALGQRAPDVVHTNGIKAHLLCAVTKPANSRLVWHIRDFIGDRPYVHRALRLVASRATLALANSNAVAEDARRAIPGLPVRTLYNAIDTDAFSPGPVDPSFLDALAKLPSAPAPTLRIGLVATYARWKGHELFLRAAAQLITRDRTLPIRFYVVGGPVYATPGSQFTIAELRDTARTLGILGSVGFVPFQENTRDVYRALDIVVHASTRPEPFGRTIVEAMACGRPVIVARTGGAIELFEDGVEAQGFDSRKEEDLATAMASLAYNGERRRQLAERARARVTEQFGRQRLFDRLIASWEWPDP